jgi:AcrR family transcriptional regulator
MTRTVKSPLTPQDWIKAAFRALASEGAQAIKAEALARRLGTTKGSFYWHFKDIPAFHKEMLRLWEAEATAGIMVTVNDAAPQGSDRLKSLLKIVSEMNANNEYGGLDAEPSIRDWARHYPLAARAVKRVDAARIAYVKGLFQQAGQDDIKSHHNAELFYGTFVGMQTLAQAQKINIGERLMQLLPNLLK